jgi:hypothetical protein
MAAIMEVPKVARCLVATKVLPVEVAKVWEVLKDLDLRFIKNVSRMERNDRKTPLLGSHWTLLGKDGSIQQIKLHELSSSEHLLRYSVVEGEPKLEVPVTHTVRLRPVTHTNDTLIEIRTDFDLPEKEEVSLEDFVNAKLDTKRFFSGLTTATRSSARAGALSQVKLDIKTWETPEEKELPCPACTFVQPVSARNCEICGGETRFPMQVFKALIPINFQEVGMCCLPRPSLVLSTAALTWSPHRPRFAIRSNLIQMSLFSTAGNGLQ